MRCGARCAELLAERVFSALYGTAHLHSSKEGFTFLRPLADARHPARSRRLGAPAHASGQPPRAYDGEHFDQRASHVGLRCIQSSVALLDQTENDGCFVCWPGSHHEHQAITKGTWRGRHDWVPLFEAELDLLRAKGYSRQYVRVHAGDMILWRSDLAHSGALPAPDRLGLATSCRAVAYVSMLPAALTPASVFRTCWAGLCAGCRTARACAFEGCILLFCCALCCMDYMDCAVCCCSALNVRCTPPLCTFVLAPSRPLPRHSTPKPRWLSCRMGLRRCIGHHAFKLGMPRRMAPCLAVLIGSTGMQR